MRFAVALLALASAVAAQTVGFDVITKPTEGTAVPAGSAFTIEWTPSTEHKGTVSLTLLAGSSPQTLQVLDTIKTGVESSAGKYSWAVPSTLEATPVYGIKISLDSDPSTFQYSYPFHVVGGAKKAADTTTTAATTAASTSTSASTSTLSTSSTSAPASAAAASSTPSTSPSVVPTNSTTSTSTCISTSTSASSTSTVAPVSSAAPTTATPSTHAKTTTFVTSTKTTGPTTTATSTASASSAASATPSIVKTSGGVAGRTVSLAALLGGLALACAAL